MGFKCEGSTLKIEGKVNNIVLDGCKKCAVVFTDAVSSCEFINCQSVQMQVLGKVPTISVEKTDGCQMFLSEDSKGVEIITAKSSEMNVSIPNGDEFVEQPIPEQFKTVINGIKLSTNHTESTWTRSPKVSNVYHLRLPTYQIEHYGMKNFLM